MTTLLLNQCLHGYRDGHQLLASSKGLSQISQQELLFQTDLSGSKVDEGFDSYLTCYPLIADGLYAISKTWYAPEMSRPGCVWTQTFLIDFSDVGKINDLEALSKKFIRPTFNQYDEYAQPVDINSGNAEQFLIENNYGKIANALYTNPNKTVVVPAKSSMQYEVTIFKIWQDQWPRLRRNFTFCTGALSLKTIEEREFDFQIVPETNLYTIERQSENLLILDLNLSLDSNWIEDLKGVSKEQLKSFLWTYGSDIAGERKNYKALIDVFLSIYRNQTLNLSKIATTVKTHFPLKKDAKFLKSSLFSANSILQQYTSEKEIIIFLIAHNPNLKFVDEDELKNRTTDLLKSGKLEFSDLVTTFSKNFEEPLLQDVWDFVNGSNIIEFIDQYPELIQEIAQNKPEMFYEKVFWGLPLSVQKQILGAVYNTKSTISITKIVDAVLNAKSDIIFDFGKLYPTATVHSSLDWLNAEADREFTSNWIKTLFNNHDANTFKWYNANIKDLSDSAITLLMENIDIADMHRINFSHKTWVNIYHRNNDKSAFGFKLAAFGFQDKISGSEWLVAETLASIFYSLKKTNKPLSEYSIPTTSNLDDEIYTPYQFISQMIWGNPKNQKRGKSEIDQTFFQVVLYSFIKNKWSRQAFLYGLKDDHLFASMLHIALQSNKGTYFITNVLEDLNRKKIQAYGNQIPILMEITNRY